MADTSEAFQTSAAAGRPSFKVRSDWYTMMGTAFGLREPAILGAVDVALSGAVDFNALDQAMADFIEEPVPDDLAGDTEAQRLAARSLFWAGALQRQLQIPVFGHGHIRSGSQNADDSETIDLAAPYYRTELAAGALSWVAGAIDSFLAAGGMSPRWQQAAQSQFDRVADAIKKSAPKGVNTFRLLRAANEQKVQVRQFMPDMFCFGVGARSRWLDSSLTDRTSFIAIKVAKSKMTAAHMMRAAGLPIAPNAVAETSDDAMQIARKFGYPVVIKPADAGRGEGVAVDLKSDGAVAAAYEKARLTSKNVLVEKHFSGTDYRMTVIDGRLVRVSCRLPFGVVGDGIHTVSELVEIAKQTPKQQQELRERGRSLIDIDDEALALLAERQLDRDSVLPKDQRVQLRKLANVSAGATGSTVAAEDIHPENRLLAIRAAAALRLDVAGIDVILPDISRSWIETGAHICEVNVRPQFGPAGVVVMLPAILGGNGRIPILLAIGRSDAIDWPQLRERLPSTIGLGFASDDCTWLGENRLAGKVENGFRAGQILLENTQTEAAVVVMSPLEVARIGLPFDVCDILLLDDPQRWDEQDRAALQQLLVVALPHAERTVTLAPLDTHMEADRAVMGAQAIGFETLQQACETLLGDLLKDDTASSPHAHRR